MDYLHLWPVPVPACVEAILGVSFGADGLDVTILQPASDTHTGSNPIRLQPAQLVLPAGFVGVRALLHGASTS
jgi:hypothetical protein